MGKSIRRPRPPWGPAPVHTPGCDPGSPCRSLKSGCLGCSARLCPAAPRLGLQGAKPITNHLKDAPRQCWEKQLPKVKSLKSELLLLTDLQPSVSQRSVSHCPGPSLPRRVLCPLAPSLLRSPALLRGP